MQSGEGQHADPGVRDGDGQECGGGLPGGHSNSGVLQPRLH